MVSTSSCSVVTNETVLCSWNFCTINHDEMNRILLVIFNVFYYNMFLTYVQSCTMYQSFTIL